MLRLEIVDEKKKELIQMANDKTHERIKSALALRHASSAFVARNLIYQTGKGARGNGTDDAERQVYGVTLRSLAQARLH